MGFKIMVKEVNGQWTFGWKKNGERGRYNKVDTTYSRKYDAVRGAKRLLKSSKLDVTYAV